MQAKGAATKVVMCSHVRWSHVALNTIDHNTRKNISKTTNKLTSSSNAFFSKVGADKFEHERPQSATLYDLPQDRRANFSM